LKTLIVQSDIRDKLVIDYLPSTLSNAETIDIAKASVARWARANNFDYICYTTAIIPQSEFSDLACYGNFTEYVDFQKLFIYTDTYDRIMWLDADVVVYGNPQLDNAWFSVRYNSTIYGDPLTPRPNSGCYYGSADAFKQLYSYSQQQLSPETRDPKYQAYLSFPEIPGKGKRSCSQEILAYWMVQATNSIIPMTKDLHTFFTYDILSNNSFVHLVGNNKYFKLCLLRWLLKADDVTRSIMYDILNAQEFDELQHNDKWYKQMDLANTMFTVGPILKNSRRASHGTGEPNEQTTT
jgi:hypothetical protein